MVFVQSSAHSLDYLGVIGLKYTFEKPNSRSVAFSECRILIYRIHLSRFSHVLIFVRGSFARYYVTCVFFSVC